MYRFISNAPIRICILIEQIIHCYLAVSNAFMFPNHDTTYHRSKLSKTKIKQLFTLYTT